MPIFLGALIGALISAAGTLVGRILLSLGIGYAVYTGVDPSNTWARDFVLGRISAQGGNLLAAASTMKVGACVSILTSALVARMALNGLTGGTLRKFVVK